MLHHLKSFIPLRVKHWLRWNSPHAIDEFIRKYLGDQCILVQIGSNDGRQGDPLYKWIKRKKNWRGLLVEPVPYLFDRLKQNYRKKQGLLFFNAAISDESEHITLWSVDPKAVNSLDLPYWFDQLASFDRNHITSHLGSKIEPYIIQISVPAVSLTEAIKLNMIEKIDLLHIDTEGYDYNILRQLDFSRFRPTIIMYEHKHLQKSNYISAQFLLRSEGYILEEHGGYTIALYEGAPRLG
ncbi:FkbM family methyltransferase [Labrys monachus]|uniref:FkbM family methyltransferase n=1 Tax=Labrys monachus TaxID=217067 RepID=A0ABU0FC26_9HYPH|nr:FkbM family methyltransferase [Labrys monachus]MDQ0391877.1 FkbM family methyltransferase [Labrys monachus]